MLNPNITAKRLEEIQSLQEQIQNLADEFQKDFAQQTRLESAIEKDLHDAIKSLELLKGLYKAKTGKRK
jgi:hypothetical protein